MIRGLFAKTVYTVLRLPRLSRILLKPEKSGNGIRRLAKAVIGAKMRVLLGFSWVFGRSSGLTDKDEVRGSNPRAPTRKAFRSNELRKAFLCAEFQKSLGLRRGCARNLFHIITALCRGRSNVVSFSSVEFCK